MGFILAWLGISLVTETIDNQYYAVKNWYIEEGVTEKVITFFKDEYAKEKLKPRPIKGKYLWYMKKNIKEN